MQVVHNILSDDSQCTPVADAKRQSMAMAA